MKVYSLFHRVLEIEPHHQMQLNVIKNTEFLFSLYHYYLGFYENDIHYVRLLNFKLKEQNVSK